jgi:hypothetical protein
MKWDLKDYADLTAGGRFYYLRPRSLKARAKWLILRVLP